MSFVLSNFLDIAAVEMGQLTPDKIRRVTMSGVVDTGATSMVLPLSVVQFLGIPANGKDNVSYADRRREIRDSTDFAHAQLCNRGGPFHAVIEPNHTDALIDAIMMESLDLLVDCRNLSVHPRDANFIMAEIE